MPVSRVAMGRWRFMLAILPTARPPACGEKAVAAAADDGGEAEPNANRDASCAGYSGREVFEGRIIAVDCRGDDGRGSARHAPEWLACTVGRCRVAPGLVRGFRRRL